MRQLSRPIMMLIVLALVAGAASASGGQEEAAAEPEQLMLWTSEEQPERLDVQREINSRFEEQTGTPVEVVPVTESDMGERVT
ncbi:MAG: carbohydrate ABC transporter substrate-binding protein, partial [Spirochaetota bacterium]